MKTVEVSLGIGPQIGAHPILSLEPRLRAAVEMLTHYLYLDVCRHYGREPNWAGLTLAERMEWRKAALNRVEISAERAEDANEAMRQPFGGKLRL